MAVPRVFLLMASVAFLAWSVDSLSCICGSSPCEKPACCASGEYTYDACGCCKVCAKPVGGKCGGPWRTSGNCARSLACHRRCQCKVENSEDECIFPFKYEGETYTECTTVNSSNGKAWCATEVDSKGVAVPGKWDDCRRGCPGMKFPCQQQDLFNFDGKCVTEDEMKEIEASEALHNIHSFDFDHEAAANETASIDVAPSCDGNDNTEVVSKAKKCKCDDAVARGREGHCMQVFHAAPDFKNGWCFLNYVEDPSNPTENCHDDVEWSGANGRFFSRKACRINLVDLAPVVPSGFAPSPGPPGFSNPDMIDDSDDAVVVDEIPPEDLAAPPADSITFGGQEEE